MDGKLKWQKVKSGGTYRRKVKQYRELLLKSVDDNVCRPSPSESNGLLYDEDESSPSSEFSEHDFSYRDDEYFSPDNENICASSEEEPNCVIDNDNTNCRDGDTFKIFLRNWAIQYNIPQLALGSLIEGINSSFNTRLSKDARTLMRTPRLPALVQTIENGEYWHGGLRNALRSCFANIQSPLTINININIDGLPIYKNGTSQFWPILFNICEMPHIKPMIIGIFYGNQKPGKVEDFLDQFVEEMSEILQNGIIINNHKLTVKIRAFICDSPARAFIKGTVNFNSQYGCLKCCIVGVHSSLLHCTIFPPTKCSKRSDDLFREWAYGDHHRNYKIRIAPRKVRKVPIITPLLRLPIDMVEDIVVADSLHLLHLGVVKRLLLTYKDGGSRFEDMKWSNVETEQLSSILLKLKLPLEIHRSVRDLKHLSHWKASECAAFLNYYGIAILKNFLTNEHYENFLNLFCATTICSTNYYRSFLPVARNLFEEFNRNYYNLFSSATSNIHNLLHVVDECERFGPLPSISSYPFENHLFKIKKMLRCGRYPLAQVVNRLAEAAVNNTYNTCNVPNYPCFKYPLEKNSSKYSYIQLRDGFTLTTNYKDKWFLTKNNEIICMEHASNIGVFGMQLNKWGNFFEYPIKSSNIKVFQSTNTKNLKPPLWYDFDKILCKLAAIDIFHQTIFVPLHHTYLAADQI